MLTKIFHLNIVLCLLICGYSFAGITAKEKPSTNYEVLNRVYSEISGKVIDDLSCTSRKLLLSVEGDSNKWIFRNIFSDLLKQKQFRLMNNTDSNVCSVKIYSETKIRYSKHESDENSFIRNLFCFATVIQGDNEKNQRTYTETVTDTLGISDIQYINNAKIKITANSLEERSFFDTIIEPLIILSSSGILVYLLFTVRSK